MLEKIEAALQEVLEPVFYGSADDVGNAALWNYIVFFRDRTSRSATNKGYSNYYTVGIVHENYVPDEMIEAVISKVEALPGVRMATGDIDFNYTRKPGTNAVIEVASIPFVHALKKV